MHGGAVAVDFAAESHVDRSISGPQAFIETNVFGTFALLEVVRKHPHIHFHHVSTDEVYGCLGETGYFTETTPYSPNSPYSASKAASDHLVNAYGHTYNLSTCISNCSNNYGPYQFPEKLIPLMILNCFNGKKLPIYGQGLNVRDWLYVNDHAKAIWMILQYGKKSVNFPIKLNNKIAALGASIDHGDGKPTTASYEVHRLLNQKLAEQQSKLDTLLKLTLPPVNKELTDRSLKELVPTKTETPTPRADSAVPAGE